MINIFLVAYLAALLPSVIALAWFIWRASTLEKRPANTNHAASTRRQIRHRPGRLSENGHWLSTQVGRARIDDQPQGARR